MLMWITNLDMGGGGSPAPSGSDVYYDAGRLNYYPAHRHTERPRFGSVFLRRLTWCWA